MLEITTEPSYPLLGVSILFISLLHLKAEDLQANSGARLTYYEHPKIL